MFIELDRVSYGYMGNDGKDVPAISDISLKIEAGESVGIMGKTGCGKTTLLQIIGGLIKPESGHVLLEGKDIWDKSYPKMNLRSRIGIVFQYPEYQIFENTVEKDVAFGLKHSGLKKDQVKAQVREALEIMGFDFESIAKQPPLALSGGEKRRVAIAGVLAVRPEILLFDEPVAGLDPAGREDFYALVRRLNRQGVTVVMVSHQPDAIGECADRLIVMENGGIVKDDSVANVYRWMANHHLEDRFALNNIASVWRLGEMLRNQGLDVPEDKVKYHEWLETLIEKIKERGL